jgi:quercetin 2,3-dioxygenase
MQVKFFPKTERGVKDIGWLKSNFTFNFSTFKSPDKNGFGLLKVFNDDFVEKGTGFGLHPHANMEIISVMLAGKMNHKDSMGYYEVVEKDWVQIMSAGSGLRHEEYNVGDDEVNFLQIWIDPKVQNITPRYQKRYFPLEKRKNQIITAVSSEEGVLHCWINQNAKISLGHLDAQKTASYSLVNENMCAFVFVIDGDLKLENHTLAKRDALGIWQTNSFTISANTETQFIIIEVPIN